MATSSSSTSGKSASSTTLSSSASSSTLSSSASLSASSWATWTTLQATAALALYPETLRNLSDQRGAVKGAQLQVLDNVINTTLPDIIKSREKDGDPYITQKELSDLMKYKMLHKFRPNLQKYIEELGEEEVRLASQKAFKFLKADKLKEACNALKTLKGCGPATASLVLSTYDGSRAAYMSDAALMTVCGTKGYTLAEFIDLSTKLRIKANKLGDDWTAQKLQQAIWACLWASTNIHDDAEDKPSESLVGTKRMRDTE